MKLNSFSLLCFIEDLNYSTSRRHASHSTGSRGGAGWEKPHVRGGRVGWCWEGKRRTKHRLF